MTESVNCLTQCSTTNGNSSLAVQGGLPTTNDGEFTYLSPYKGKTVEDADIKAAFARLHGNYPTMAPMFWTELRSQVIKSGFTKQRLFDAVDYVIQTNPYKDIRIAEILNFGRGVKLYTYNQMCDIVYRDQITTNDFEMVELPDGRKLWKSKNGKY